MERQHSETDITQNSSTGGTIPGAEEIIPQSSVESDRLRLTLAFIAVILSTLSVIYAGYLHGHMSIKAVYHSLTHFT